MAVDGAVDGAEGGADGGAGGGIGGGAVFAANDSNMMFKPHTCSCMSFDLNVYFNTVKCNRIICVNKEK